MIAGAATVTIISEVFFKKIYNYDIENANKC